jgi:prevent-host-death family protein
MKDNAKKYTIAEARTHLTDVLNKASYGKERIEVLRRNKPIAYIVPIEDVEMLEKIEDMMDIQDADARKEETIISLDELRKELDL